MRITRVVALLVALGVAALASAAAPAPSAVGPGGATLVSVRDNIADAKFLLTSADGAATFFLGRLEANQGNLPFHSVFVRADGATVPVTSSWYPDNVAYASPDLRRLVWNHLPRNLVTGAENQFGEIYRWDALTRERSKLAGGASYTRLRAISRDATRVFFTENDGEDLDQPIFRRVFEHSNGQMRQVSPLGRGLAYWGGASDDGRRVFFMWEGRLAASDTDDDLDVYERSSGVTRLVSTGTERSSAIFNTVAGSAVFFTTGDAPLAGDTDTWNDIYRVQDGVMTRVSSGNGPFHAFFAGSSADGSRVMVRTDEPLSSLDTDSTRDLYLRTWAPSTNQWTGSTLLTPRTTTFVMKCISANGLRMIFTTGDRLTIADTDDLNDVYGASVGLAGTASISLLSGSSAAERYAVGSRVKCSADASKVAFETREKLVSTDSDDTVDVYVHSGNPVTKVSTGNGDLDFWGRPIRADATLDAISDGGQYVFFTTREKLSTADTDTSPDVYRRAPAP